MCVQPWLLEVVHFKKTTEWLLLLLDMPLQAHTTRVGLHLAPQSALQACGIGCFHGANMACVALKMAK